MESECAMYQNLKNPKLKYFTLKVKLVNNYNYFFLYQKKTENIV